MTEVLFFTIAILIFLFSVILHEISHGAAADYLGDPTARMAGRLTLNPLKHLDPVGSVLLPVMLILINSGIIVGWAKPVPVNPLNFKDKIYGSAKVAAAGPLANILIAVFFGFLIRVFPLDGFLFGQNLGIIFSFIVWINLLLAIFNLIPIPPLDGSHILFTFLPRELDQIKVFLSRYGFFVLIFFIFFLLPLLIPVVRFLFLIIVGESFI